jgi:two-component SAPR family response regulator
MFNNVPEDVVVYIFTFLSFKEKDFIRIRNVCKIFQSLMDNVITIDCYPYLRQESFTSFTVSYHQHMNYLKQLQEESEKEFDITYLNMLTENGWV